MTAKHADQIRKADRQAEGLGPPLFFMVALLAGLLPLHSPAFEKPKAYCPHPTPKVAPELEDAYDLLYLGKLRPVWLRLHVRISRQLISARWERYLDSLFQDLDTNGDGTLDAKECERLPSPAMLRTIIQSGNIFPMPPAPNAFSQMDTRHTGHVDRNQLAEYYRRLDVNNVRFQTAFDLDPYAEGISRAIFRLLDADGDGQLSKSEVAHAEKMLDRQDLDEDECLSVQELLPDLFTGRLQTQNRRSADLNRFLLSRPAEPINGLAKRFLKIYDLDKDYHLSRAESGLDHAAFDRLDRDHNGKLDVPELADLFENGLPDVEAWFEVINPKVAAALTKYSARSDMPGIHRLGTRFRIELKPGESIQVGELRLSSNALFESKNGSQLMPIFNHFAGMKGFIDAKDFQLSGMKAYQPFITLGDRNRDGRVTRPEMKALIELHQQALNATATFTIFGQCPNWFAALDLNHDGRLSRHELQRAWKSLSALQEPPVEFIPPAEKEQRMRLVVHQGPSSFFSGVSMRYLQPRQRTAPLGGPLWFRKMDRNADGFVSRREFLGSKEEFDRIDRNGDGMIDLKEASQAETKK